MTVRLRAGTLADVAGAAGIWVAATDARRADLGLEPAGSVARTVDLYLTRLAVPTTALLVAADDGDVVGMALTMQAVANDGAGPGIEPGLLHISSVAVAPSRWGSGIGGQLITAILRAAADLGYERAQLWTHEINHRAQALYRRHGFHPSGRAKIDDNDELLGHWVVRLA